MTRILIADDNSQVRRALRNLVEQDEDWKVCGEAIDGGDAIERAKETHPDLIVLDFQMPVMNGLQIACRLRKIAPVTAIILFTLYGHELPIEQAAAIGVNLVLSKTDNIFSVVSQAHELMEHPGVPTRKPAGP